MNPTPPRRITYIPESEPFLCNSCRHSRLFPIPKTTCLDESPLLMDASYLKPGFTQTRVETISRRVNGLRGQIDPSEIASEWLVVIAALQERIGEAP